MCDVCREKEAMGLQPKLIVGAADDPFEREADAAAAASAKEVAARAYTVGSHVVFGADSYAPATRDGRSLIAHDLAHVVQQTGTVQRASLWTEAVGNLNGEEEEEEAQQAALVFEEEQEGFGGIVQRFPRGKMFGDEPLDPWPEKTEAAMIMAEMKAVEDCMKNMPPDPVECDPNRALTWNDFAGPQTCRARSARPATRGSRSAPRIPRS
jgi:hypothetical protein